MYIWHYGFGLCKQLSILRNLQFLGIVLHKLEYLRPERCLWSFLFLLFFVFS
jgi:hypothetical protein